MLSKDDMVTVVMQSFWKHTVFFFLGAAVLAALFFYAAPGAEAGAAHNLSGFAWSSNIGWLSFNSSNCDRPNRPAGCPSGTIPDYGVNVAKNGDMSGYAWSSNIGWISFDGIKGCPSNPCKPTFDSKTGEVNGWAKAIAAKDGWDGWIRLKGTNYGVKATDCNWGGYAWGSDVVGWIHFQGGNYGVLGQQGSDACVQQPVEITVEPPPPPLPSDQPPPPPPPPGQPSPQGPSLQYPAPAQLTLCADAPKKATCDRSGSWSGPINPGDCQAIGPLAVGTYTYNLTCTDEGKTLSDSKTIVVVAPLCSDGLDNDNDGLFDLDDPGCNDNPNDNSEGDAGISFKASRTVVSPTQSVTLTWKTDGYQSCTLTKPGANLTLQGSPTNGSKDDVPSAPSTTYTLTCVVGNQSDSRTQKINVSRVPKFKEITPR